MTVNDASHKQALALVEALAKIQHLIYTSDQGSDDLKAELKEAFRLIEYHTLDIRLREVVLNKLGARHASLGSDSWKLEALNTYNAAMARARETDNKIFAGTLYLQRGLYKDASLIFLQCPQSDELVSHVQVIQRNWPYLIARFNHQFDRQAEFSNEVLLNIALANWCSGQYGDCIAVLLRLNIGDTKEFRGIWLSHNEVKAMVVISALLSLDLETLNFFLYSDPIAQHFKVSLFANTFFEPDVNQFWMHYDNSLTIPWLSTEEEPKMHLRDKLLKNWLHLYNKVPLGYVLKTFGLNRAEHKEFKLIEDLHRWNAPYKVDFVDQQVVYNNNPPDPSTLANRLAWEFKRDSLLLLWNKNLSD